jgi:hypothetical protein
VCVHTVSSPLCACDLVLLDQNAYHVTCVFPPNTFTSLWRNVYVNLGGTIQSQNMATRFSYIRTFAVVVVCSFACSFVCSFVCFLLCFVCVFACLLACLFACLLVCLLACLRLFVLF